MIHTGKPIYWVNSGIHSPETGGPEMLIELAYRMIIEETPFIQAIRNNAILLITPVIEDRMAASSRSIPITTARRPANSGRR